MNNNKSIYCTLEKVLTQLAPRALGSAAPFVLASLPTKGGVS